MSEQEQKAEDGKLMLRAMIAGPVFWRPFLSDPRTGELVLDGLRYSLRLDAEGLPVLNEAARSRLAFVVGKAGGKR